MGGRSQRCFSTRFDFHDKRIGNTLYFGVPFGSRRNSREGLDAIQPGFEQLSFYESKRPSRRRYWKSAGEVSLSRSRLHERRQRAWEAVKLFVTHEIEVTGYFESSCGVRWIGDGVVSYKPFSYLRGDDKNQHRPPVITTIPARAAYQIPVFTNRDFAR